MTAEQEDEIYYSINRFFISTSVPSSGISSFAQKHDSNTSTSSSSSATPTARAKAEGILRELQDTFFPSAAFCAWLTIVTKLIPLSCAVEARRFRPGLDYTLATSDEGESRLDVVLGLTPQVQPKMTEFENRIRLGKAKAKATSSDNEDEDEDQPTGWQAGEWGGWEVRLAVPLALAKYVSCPLRC